MAVATFVRVLVIGAPQAYPVVEDALSALKCMDVTRVDRGEMHFEVEGWLPEAWIDDLREILDRGARGLVDVARVEGARAEVAAPVALSNPRVARPFEYLVELFSLPGQRSFDPTLATFLGLPLFLGLVVGDAGYGLALAAAGLVVRRRYHTPFARMSSTLLLAGGAWSVLFGLLLFGDVLAFRVRVGPSWLAPVDRLHDANLVLALALVVGLAHVAIGLVIGFVYDRRRVGLRAAALRKLSWLVLEAGLVALGLGALGFALPGLREAGLALVAVAVVMVSFGGGIVDVVDVPRFVTNLVSYVRLGALAIVDAHFGHAVNEAALHGLFPLGGLGIALGVVALVAMHALLVGMAALVATLHALRLHYVEFYTKFYPLDEVGRARAFRPTGAS